MSRFVFLFVFVLSVFVSFSQTTTVPELPVATQKVTITFDSSEEDRLGFYTGDLYAHTGVRIEGKEEWHNVIGNWGDNTVQPKLSHIGNGIYEFEISPDINTFYSVSENEKITEILFVFRSDDGNKQTNNLSEVVYDEGLFVNITSPSNNSTLNQNDAVTIVAGSTLEANLKLFVDNNLIKETTGTTISENYTFTETGNYTIYAEANTTSETKRDTVG